MARTLVELTADVWTDLANGPGVVTLVKAPVKAGSGQLYINNSQDIPSAIPLTRHRIGAQIISQGDTLVVSAFPTGAGWVVAMDF